MGYFLAALRMRLARARSFYHDLTLTDHQGHVALAGVGDIGHDRVGGGAFGGSLCIHVLGGCCGG
jgi:hypothetical protein